MNLQSITFPGLDGKYEVPAPLDPSQFAPGGYGLGSTYSTIALDLDDVTLVNGVYNIDERTANKPSGITYGHLHVLSQYTNKVYIIYNKTAHGGVLKRQIVNGTAYPWEWFNPPMAVGVEYRTTERYNGKPVYAMAIDCGAMPNATIKSVATTIPKAAIIVEQNVTYHIATTGDTGEEVIARHTSPYMTNSYWTLRHWWNSMGTPYQNFMIEAKDDRSTTTALVTVKYTKD